MAKIYKFESGLSLVYEKNNINKSTSIQVRFGCGSRCDGNIPGLSHFCEHMFFAGTNKLSKQQVVDRYFKFGNVNAYTNTEDIAFVGTIMSNKLAEYLTTVQDLVCNSAFAPDAIEEEKKIVIQEIVKDADNYPSRAYEFEHYGLYGLQHYKNGELGSEQSVSSITSKDVKKYVKKYFVKNNCSIFICSALSFDKVKRIVKKYFDSVMPSNNLKPFTYSENKFVKGNIIQQQKNNIGKNFVSVFLKVDEASVDVKSRAHLGMFSNIIGEFSTGITKELRLDNSLVYSAYSYYIINKTNSALIISTEISKENIKPCLDVIFKYINNLKLNGFTKELYDKEKDRNEYYWQTDVLSPRDICFNLKNIRLYGRYVSYKEIYEAYKKVSYEELNESVKDFINRSEILVSVYGDADKKDVYTLKQIEKKFTC